MNIIFIFLFMILALYLGSKIKYPEASTTDAKAPRQHKASDFNGSQYIEVEIVGELAVTICNDTAIFHDNVSLLAAVVQKWDNISVELKLGINNSGQLKDFESYLGSLQLEPLFESYLDSKGMSVILAGQDRGPDHEWAELSDGTIIDDVIEMDMSPADTTFIEKVELSDNCSNLTYNIFTDNGEQYYLSYADLKIVFDAMESEHKPGI